MPLIRLVGIAAAAIGIVFLCDGRTQLRSVISDGLEYVQLVDESCRGSAIDVQVREPYASDPEISNLIKLAYARGMRDSSEPIAATFTGVLKHQPGGFPRIILNVVGVADIVSEPEPQPTHNG